MDYSPLDKNKAINGDTGQAERLKSAKRYFIVKIRTFAKK
jgi:hypothetical protein